MDVETVPQTEQADLLSGVRRFATSRRAPDEARALARTVAKEWPTLSAGKPLTKVALLPGFNTDYLVDFIRMMLLARGVYADIRAADYGQVAGEILGNGPALRDSPDLVVIAVSHRDLRHAPPLGCTREEADQAAEQEAAYWARLVGRIAAPVVMFAFDQPGERVLENLDGFAPGSVGRHARKTNLALYDQLPGSASLIDTEALQARLGTDWNDAYVYALCKQPFVMRALTEVADAIAAQAAAALGKSRKVLVLDLDNTLWGGVIGDDGVEAIELGPETPEGEAFHSFQRYVKALGQRGVILAVCSKNHHDVALGAFRNHPAMVLREEDIASFAVNFEEKASNIRAIAAALNVGLDSVAFVDDNPVERQWVQRQLPEVAVIDLPENPAHYARAVSAARLFPMTRLTSEDIGRGKSYRSMAVTREAKESAEDYDAFLQELEPVAVIEAVDGHSLDRISQLIGKTNQFKIARALFTVEALRGAPGDVLAIRVKDRLQDYGIVAVAVVQTEGATLRIRNWVMSCRVFGRRLEHLTRALLGLIAQARGATTLKIAFEPSAKNGAVPEALESAGFRRIPGTDDFEAPALPETPLPAHYMSINDARTKASHDA